MTSCFDIIHSILISTGIPPQFETRTPQHCIRFPGASPSFSSNNLFTKVSTLLSVSCIACSRWCHRSDKTYKCVACHCIQAAIVEHFAQDNSGVQWCTMMYPTTDDPVPEGLPVRKAKSFVELKLLDLLFAFWCLSVCWVCVLFLLRVSHHLNALRMIAIKQSDAHNCQLFVPTCPEWKTSESCIDPV